MAESRPRRERDPGGIAWLAGQVTGDLADAITRDLISDHLDFNQIHPDDMRAYIEAAPPGTAIYYVRNEGWTPGDHLAAEQLDVQRRLYWRYGAVHFQGGDKEPFPESIPRPGVVSVNSAATWEEALEDPASPQVVAMLKGA